MKAASHKKKGNTAKSVLDWAIETTRGTDTQKEMRFPLAIFRRPAVLLMCAEIDEFGMVSGFTLSAVPGADAMKSAMAAYLLAGKMVPLPGKKEGHDGK